MAKYVYPDEEVWGLHTFTKVQNGACLDFEADFLILESAAMPVQLIVDQRVIIIS